jgi:hypothetical protein
MNINVNTFQSLIIFWRTSEADQSSFLALVLAHLHAGMSLLAHLSLCALHLLERDTRLEVTPNNDGLGYI